MADFGKIIDGKLYYAPKVLNDEGKQYINPPEGLYIKFGYLPLEYTTIPDIKEGYHVNSSWINVGDKLIQTWNYEADEETSVLMQRLRQLEERVGELTYSLRQISDTVVEVEKKDNSELENGDYLNPILLTAEGINVEKGLFYYVDDPQLPREAKFDAFCNVDDFNDPTWFEIVG